MTHVIIRRNPDGTLDEVVAEGVNLHLEQMDDGAWWLGVTDPATGQLIHINLYSKRAIGAVVDIDDGPVSRKAAPRERREGEGRHPLSQPKT